MSDMYLLHPELELLLREKNFEDLSNADQSLVLQHISEQDYRQYREILLQAAGVGRAAGPSPAVARRLQAAMKARSKSKMPLRHTLSAPVPVWLAAAFALLLLGVMQLWQLRQNSNAAPVVAYVSDTVQITTILRDTIFMANPVPAAIIVQKITDTITLFQAPPETAQPIAMLHPDSVEKSWSGQVPRENQGYSLRDDSVYLKLLRTVR
ncbi:MAG: hypothetical protein IPL65_15835 [Lewinellaceae bacterium]|nr:hypothetical protein [Lewinellaceae bacterium]